MSDSQPAGVPWIDPDEIRLLMEPDPDKRYEALVLGVRFVHEPPPMRLRIAGGVWGIALVLVTLALCQLSGH
jgi:hypothetical protein